MLSADELDEVTRKAIGGDVAGDIRRLEDALVQLREHFQETKKLATAAEDAAAKCQVRARFFFLVLLLPSRLPVLPVDAFSSPRQHVVYTISSRGRAPEADAQYLRMEACGRWASCVTGERPQ